MDIQTATAGAHSDAGADAKANGSHAAAFAAVEDVTAFHSSDFLSEAMRLNAVLGVSATPNGLRIPSSRVIAEFYRSSY